MPRLLTTLQILIRSCWPRPMELEKTTHDGNVDLFLSKGRGSCLRRAEVCSQDEVSGWNRFWSVLGSNLVSLLSGWVPEVLGWILLTGLLDLHRQRKQKGNYTEIRRNLETLKSLKLLIYLHGGLRISHRYSYSPKFRQWGGVSIFMLVSHHLLTISRKRHDLR